MNSPQTPAISTKGWTYESVLQHGKRFRPIERIKATAPETDIQEAIRRYEEDGIPMIIEGWHEHKKWRKDMFSLDFFQKHCGREDIHVRNVHDLKDTTWRLDEFIAKSRQAPPCVADNETTRMYGKDAECPPQWKEWIEKKNVIPSSLLWNGPQDYFRYRPEATQVETLMCYLGIGDTFTAAHKDLCASSGHNLMCYTENGGASYWFMTRGCDAPIVGEYFQKLGQELDHETHVITLDELKNAPFDVFVGKQVLGDLVLVPPRSCHQVVNFGGITLKTSWSRMSLKGLTTAVYHELPLYQRVCRFETYRVKSTVYLAVQKQTKELEDALKGRVPRDLSKSQSLATLTSVFTHILAEEYSRECKAMTRLDIDTDGQEHDAGAETERHIVCDFCGCDVFQSFFECSNCIPSGGGPRGCEGYAICPSCYVEGRSCRCVTMEPKQVFSFLKLMNVRQAAVEILKACGHELTPWTPGQQRGSIFYAACLLRKRRTSRKGQLICKLDQDKLPKEALNCNECHHSRCYEHLLLNSKMHSSIALPDYPNGKEHGKYHRLHQQQRKLYGERLTEAKECQKHGDAPDPSLVPVLRTYLAASHDVCRPVVFYQSLPGFYDERIQDCDEEVVEESDAESEILEELAVGSLASTLTPCPSTVVPLPAEQDAADDVEMAVYSIRRVDGLGLTLDDDDTEKSTPQPPTMKRKPTGQLMDYVAVPERRKSSGPASDFSAVQGKDAIKMKNLQALASNGPYTVKDRKVKRLAVAVAGRAGPSKPLKNFVPAADARKENASALVNPPEQASSSRVKRATINDHVASESESSSDDSVVVKPAEREGEQRVFGAAPAVVPTEEVGASKPVDKGKRRAVERSSEGGRRDHAMSTFETGKEKQNAGVNTSASKRGRGRRPPGLTSAELEATYAEEMVKAIRNAHGLEEDLPENVDEPMRGRKLQKRKTVDRYPSSSHSRSPTVSSSPSPPPVQQKSVQKPVKKKPRMEEMVVPETPPLSPSTPSECDSQPDANPANSPSNWFLSTSQPSETTTHRDTLPLPSREQQQQISSDVIMRSDSKIPENQDESLTVRSSTAKPSTAPLTQTAPSTRPVPASSLSPLKRTLKTGLTITFKNAPGETRASKDKFPSQPVVSASFGSAATIDLASVINNAAVANGLNDGLNGQGESHGISSLSELDESTGQPSRSIWPTATRLPSAQATIPRQAKPRKGAYKQIIHWPVISHKALRSAAKVL
ncbi:hypothetical protein EST38_g7126 [Candolleomyces aberdarensis]|uniref:JmjC domain-containing protein n=1 Tax=Candolleomyces aberdarensis TaxID=2316362 RepID=A0A4V1Q3I7_9AGAR|nr:hypothetical protein EST38_g7126 [Candolleomyces aberdarensis]